MVLDQDLLIKPRSSGIVIPPAEIKKLADKTAEYVAKNGSNFEDLVLQKELNNPKFCFLKRDDPYRAYYEHKITEYARGLVEVQAEEPIEAPTQRNLLADIQPPVPGKKMTIKAPQGDQFHVELPRNLSQMDLDVIKHTAMFVAKNGKKFLVSLTEREKQNPQFDFLKPTNDLFQFFLNMVDAYTKSLQPKREDIDRLLLYVQDKNYIYQRCLDRYEYESQEKSQKERKQQQDDEEKQQMAMIDWNDFVVTETIEFHEEERVENVIEKGTQRFDKIDFSTMEPSISKQIFLYIKIDVLTNVGAYNQPQIRTLPSTQKTEQDEIIQSTDAPIIKNYVRPTKLNEQVMVKCEICNKNFPKNQINEHLQLELQDPRYMEIKKEILDMDKNSIMPQGQVIARHLSQLKKKRPDIFTQEEDNYDKYMPQRPPPPPPPSNKPQPPSNRPPEPRKAPPPPPPPK